MKVLHGKQIKTLISEFVQEPNRTETSKLNSYPEPESDCGDITPTIFCKRASGKPLVESQTRPTRYSPREIQEERKTETDRNRQCSGSPKGPSSQPDKPPDSIGPLTGVTGNLTDGEIGRIFNDARKAKQNYKSCIKTMKYIKNIPKIFGYEGDKVQNNFETGMSGFN